MVNALEKTFITLAKAGEELSKTCKIEYLCTSATTKQLNPDKMMTLGDDEKMNDFVKAKNFLLLSNGHLDSSKKCTHGISAAKRVRQMKPKKLLTAKKVSIDDFNHSKDHIPNKDFWALSPGSHKKWNNHRTAAHMVRSSTTMTLTTGDSEDKKIPPQFDLEMYKMAREHAHMIM